MTEPQLYLQTDIPVPDPRRLDLCCTPDSPEDPCLLGEGGVYLPGALIDQSAPYAMSGAIDYLPRSLPTWH